MKKRTPRGETTVESSQQAIDPVSLAGRSTGLLASLGLYGLDHLDAIVLAALASEAPLLLIGPHGSAKSALLNRAAAALGLDHRHYNASLLSFDDLLGFPVPNDARDGLQYLRTPGDSLGRAIGVPGRDLALPARGAEQAVLDRARAARDGHRARRRCAIAGRR